MSTTNRRRFGNDREAIAASFLEFSGFQVLERNLYTRYGEVDVLAQRDGIVYFFEVRSKQGRAYGTPKESITPRKKATMRRVLYAVKKERGLSLPCKLGFVGISRCLEEEYRDVSFEQGGGLSSASENDGFSAEAKGESLERASGARTEEGRRAFRFYKAQSSPGCIKGRAVKGKECYELEILSGI